MPWARRAAVFADAVRVTVGALFRSRPRCFEAFTPAWLYALALILNTLVAFVLLYGLAIYHRRSPGTHARWMSAPSTSSHAPLRSL